MWDFMMYTEAAKLSTLGLMRSEMQQTGDLYMIKFHFSLAHLS